jgi:hypothetical protein
MVQLEDVPNVFLVCLACYVKQAVTVCLDFGLMLGTTGIS